MIAQLAAIGYKNKEIADMLDLSASRVSIILSDDRAQIDINSTISNVADNIIDLHDRLKAHAIEALDEIVDEVRHSKDERIRQRAAFGILDRAGYTPVQKHMNVAPELPADVAARMENALSEVEDDAVEAEYEFIEETDVEIDVGDD